MKTDTTPLTIEQLIKFIEDEIDVTPAMDGFDWDDWERKQAAVLAILKSHITKG